MTEEYDEIAGDAALAEQDERDRRDDEAWAKQARDARTAAADAIAPRFASTQDHTREQDAELDNLAARFGSVRVEPLPGSPVLLVCGWDWTARRSPADWVASPAPGAEWLLLHPNGTTRPVNRTTTNRTTTNESED